MILKAERRVAEYFKLSSIDELVHFYFNHAWDSYGSGRPRNHGTERPFGHNETVVNFQLQLSHPNNWPKAEADTKSRNYSQKNESLSVVAQTSPVQTMLATVPTTTPFPDE